MLTQDAPRPTAVSVDPIDLSVPVCVERPLEAHPLVKRWR